MFDFPDNFGGDGEPSGAQLYGDGLMAIATGFLSHALSSGHTMSEWEAWTNEVFSRLMADIDRSARGERSPELEPGAAPLAYHATVKMHAMAAAGYGFLDGAEHHKEIANTVLKAALSVPKEMRYVG